MNKNEWMRVKTKKRKEKKSEWKYRVNEKITKQMNV